MNNFMLKRILPSFLSLSLIFSLVPAGATNSKNKDEKNQKTSSASLFSKTIKKVTSHPKTSTFVAVLATLSAPMIYSNIKYSKPRDITNVKGQTDQEIKKYETISPGGVYDPNEKYILNRGLEVHREIENIICEMNEHGCKSDYEKAIFLHDYICKNCRYDHASFIGHFISDRFVDGFCHTIYGCLVNKCAVCDGIAKAYALLCHVAGIQCRAILGNAGNGEEANHVWNIIRINNQWYHVDICADSQFNIGQYKYFMFTESERGRHHRPYVLH